MANYDTLEKVKARHNSIIVPYRNLFSHSLSPNKQYLTLTAEHDFNNNLSESRHLCDAGLLTTVKQYHGINNDIKIVNRNKINIPEANFWHGDIYQFIKERILDDTFNPGIIYIDTTGEPVTQITKTLRIMQLLQYVFKDMMIVVNFILKNPNNGKVYTIDGINEMIRHNEAYKELFDDNGGTIWKYFNTHQYFNNKTEMGSYIFYFKHNVLD